MKTLIAVIFCLSTLFSGPAKGQWQWISPQPTGLNIRDLSFINDNTGYIITQNSVIFKTTNSADSWSKISERDFGNSWSEFMFLNEFTGYLNDPDWTTSNLYRTTNGGYNWNTCFSVDGVVWDFDFINASTGFAIAENIFYKTTNAGINWSAQYAFPSRVTKLEFYDSDHGLAYANFDHVLWITTNGGINWTAAGNFTDVEKIFFVDQNVVYLSDAFYNVHKSTNSGLNWEYKGNSTGIKYFENELTGYGTYYQGVLKRTTDGAVTWNTFVQSDKKPTGIIAFEPNVFYSVGNGGYIVKSDDRGLNWHSMTQSITEKSRSLFFADNNTGVIAGEDNIIKTSDGGDSWTQILDLDSNGIQNLFSPDNQLLYAACKGGYFGVSSDFGNTWNFSYTGYPVDFSKVYFVNHNTGFLIKYNSDKFYLTQNGGTTWNENNQIPKVRDIKFTDNLTGYAITTENNSFYKTTDGGVSWFTISSFPFNAAGLRDLIFTGSGNAFVSRINQNSGSTYLYLIYKTTNSGMTWSEVFRSTIFDNFQNIPDAIYNLQVTNDNSIISQYGNSAVKSEDFGITWRNIIYPYTTDINYFFPSSEIGYIAGNNIIGKIENGGTVSINNITTNIVPESIHLSQNYPNPFNPETIINYELGIRNFVSLKVYNTLGKEVATLVNEVQFPGNYNYQFSTDNYQLSSGVYFYRLESGGFVETKRMVLLK